MLSFSSHALCTQPIQSRISLPRPTNNRMNYKIEQYIFRLDVTMDNQLLVNVVNPLNDLSDYTTDLRLLHATVLSQHF